jgi:hypothetical protein
MKNSSEYKHKMYYSALGVGMQNLVSPATQMLGWVGIRLPVSRIIGNRMDRAIKQERLNLKPT